MNAFLLMTDKCMIHCKYCFYSTDYLRRETRSFSQQNEFCEWVKENKCEEVILTGGDPLHEDCFRSTIELIHRLSALKCLVSIDTSFIVDDGKIRALSQEKIKKIYVSCDSHIAEIHDFQRGRSKATFGAIKLGVATGLPIAINCTITAKNAPTVMSTYRYFHNLGVEDINFNMAFIPEKHALFPMLACEQMSIGQKRKLASDLSAIAQGAKSFSAKRYARLQAMLFLDGEWDDSIISQIKCQMGENLFVIDQTGAVKTCFHREEIIGQINDRCPTFSNRFQEKENSKECFGKHCCSLFVIDSFWHPV